MTHPFVSPGRQLALYLGAATVAALMWVVPGDATLGLGLAIIALIIGLAVFDHRQSKGWPNRIREVLDDVLGHVADLDADAFTVRVLPHGLPDARSARTRDGRPLVVVSQGMRALGSDADALWFVIAHEVAHHALGHVGYRDDPEATPAARLATARGLEFEADAWACTLALRAGRDPMAGIRSLNVLGKIEARALSGRPRPPYHPAPSDRIAALRARLDAVGGGEPSQG